MPARVADDHRAGHRELRHRPVAAGGDRLRAPADPLAALEDLAHHRVGLELLQEVVGGAGRVGVVEVEDEADRDQVLAGLLVHHRVDPGAADLVVLGGDLQRPAGHACGSRGPAAWPPSRPPSRPAPRPAARAPRRGRTRAPRRRSGGPSSPRRARSPWRRCRCRARSCPAPRRLCRAPCRRSARRRRRRRRRSAAWPRSRSAGRRRPPRPGACM